MKNSNIILKSAANAFARTALTFLGALIASRAVGWAYDRVTNKQ